MWKKIHSELYRNDNGHAIIIKRDSLNYPVHYFIDDTHPELAIPILDFFYNPVFQIPSNPEVMQFYTDALRITSDKVDAFIQSLYVSIVAKEKINSFSPLNIYGHCSDSSLPHKVGKCHGIAIKDIYSGVSGNAQLYGLIHNPLWNFVPGETVFLNEKDFSHLIPATGFVQKIGTAKDNNSLYLSIQEPIAL